MRIGKSTGVALEWKPQDLWVGVFWKTTDRNCPCGRQNCENNLRYLNVWICIIPCIPIHIERVYTRYETK